MQFIITIYIHGWINVKCRQNYIKNRQYHKKRVIFSKRKFKRACPFKNGRLPYTGDGDSDYANLLIVWSGLRGVINLKLLLGSVLHYC